MRSRFSELKWDGCYDLYIQGEFIRSFERYDVAIDFIARYYPNTSVKVPYEA